MSFLRPPERGPSFSASANPETRCRFDLGVQHHQAWRRTCLGSNSVADPRSALERCLPSRPNPLLVMPTDPHHDTLLGPAPPAFQSAMFVGAEIYGYVVEQLLGTGAMGEVWRVRQKMLKLPRAMKVLKANIASVDRFEEEMRMLAMIKHDNVVKVIDSGAFPDKSLFYVMEFVAGRNLADDITKHKGQRPQWEYIRDIILQVCDGLAAIHARGIIHRDVKPANCMLSLETDKNVHVKIVDLGVAKRLSLDTANTSEGFFIGTPSYASPEQAAGETSRVTYRSDVYGVGVMLYELLTGKIPHMPDDGEWNLQALLYQRILGRLPPPPSSFVPPGTFPPEFDDIVARALQPEPIARFQSMREFADALRQGTSITLLNHPTPRRADLAAQTPRSSPAPTPQSSLAPASPAPTPPGSSVPTPRAAPTPQPAKAISSPLPPILVPEPPDSGFAENASTEILPGGGSTPRSMTEGHESSGTHPAVPAANLESTPTGAYLHAASQAGTTAIAAKGAPAQASPRRKWISIVLVLGGLVALGLAVAVPMLFTTPTVQEPPSVEPIFRQAYDEMRTLGLADLLRHEESLRGVIDANDQPPAQKARARLLASELVLRRALACQIAVAFDDTALDGKALLYSKKDLDLADTWFARVPPKLDPAARDRVKALSLISKGATDTVVIEILPPEGAEELVALAKASPFWRDKTAIPEPGLISALQRVANPTTLLRSVVALLLWRRGQTVEARSILKEVVSEVPDQPTAVALLSAMSREEATVTPLTPVTQPAPVPAPSAPIVPDRTPSRPEHRSPQGPAAPPPGPSPGPETPRVPEVPEDDSMGKLMPIKRKESQVTPASEG